MSLRRDHRARYIEGWNTMDAARLLASITDDFVFDDPADPAPITREGLVAYMPVWPERAAGLGGSFDFEMTDRVVQDQGGFLTEWYWWRLTGTGVTGSALIRTCDAGVMYEKLTYFQTPWPLRR